MPATSSGQAGRPRTVVLDTGAVLAGLGPAQAGGQAAPPVRFVAPARVREEVRPGGPTGRSLERQEAAGLLFLEPSGNARRAVETVARQSGDLARLSATDLDVLAIAWQARQGGGDTELWSDDHAVQNVARRLDVPTRSPMGRDIRAEIQWHIRCTGCGRYVEKATPAGECPVCGSALKRTRRPPPA